MTTIDTTALTKHYGDTVAVDNLNLSIPEGVVYGFLSPIAPSERKGGRIKLRTTRRYRYSTE